MQKARRHTIAVLRPLVCVWLQGLFTPLFRVLFTFPSRYLFSIGLSGVFSLTGWCRQILTQSLLSRHTQDTTNSNKNCLYGTITLCRSASHLMPILFIIIYRSPITPIMPQHNWFGLLQFRSPLLSESLLFSPPMGT